MPPRNSAAVVSQPSRYPATTPGVAFRTTSSRPARRFVRRLPSSSSPVYSRPSMSSSRMTPISAPISMNSRAVTRSRNPPSPRARPATR